MSHINFQSGTVVPSTWLQDLDTVAYTYFGNGTSLNSPAKLTIPSVVTPLIEGAGLLIRSNPSGDLIFSAATGVASCNSDNTTTWGSATKRWSSVFTLTIDSGTTGSLSLKTNNGTPQVTIRNSGTMGIGGADGATTGKGITFPSSQSASSDANTLDDYAEGTFTPTIGGSATYTVQTGTYTKIGRLVSIRGQIAINLVGTGNTTQISGLPFTCESASNGTISVDVNGSAVTTIVSAVGQIFAAESKIRITSRTAASTGSAENAIFANGTNVYFGGTYHV